MLKRSLALMLIFAFSTAMAVEQKTQRCSSSVMTSALFLKIEGIRGDSRDQCHHDEIELLSFQNSGSATTVTKKIDSSSPHLFLAALERRTFPEVVLTVLEGTQHRLLTYKMRNAIISAVDQTAGSADRESVELRFASLLTESEPSKATAPPTAPAAIQVSVAVGQSQSAASMLTGGVASGQLREFVIVKPLDTASQKLMQAFQSGQPLAEIVVTLRPSGGSDSLTYKLSDVLVSGDTQQGSASTQSETVRLKPSRIIFQYSSSSRPSAAVKAGWDLKSAKRM